MVDTKKEQEREELHRAIWAIADDLRGAVDGWDFKSYVLGTMFYRYISENIASYINQGEIDANPVQSPRAVLAAEEPARDAPFPQHDSGDVEEVYQHIAFPSSGHLWKWVPLT